MLQDEMAETFRNYLIGGVQVKQIEDNKFEIATPYQDTKSRIILFASHLPDGRIRISDGGYLTDNFLNVQESNTPFVVDMGLHSNGADGECGCENGESVIYATPENFGQSICTLAHAIMMVGTSKGTVLMMLQVFKAVLSGAAVEQPRQKSPFSVEEIDSLDWDKIAGKA